MSESVWPVRCAHCGELSFKPVRDVNRATKKGARLFCDLKCAGQARRLGRSNAEKVALKAAYDAEYRRKNRAKLKAKKSEYFQRTYDPEKAREERKARMPRHVEYCRRPEYRKWKAQYDRKYRTRKIYGDFGEAAIALNDLITEINSRITRTEIYRQNGTLNKWIARRRQYEQATDRR